MKKTRKILNQNFNNTNVKQINVINMCKNTSVSINSKRIIPQSLSKRGLRIQPWKCPVF
jgi:hypothetical protein